MMNNHDRTNDDLAKINLNEAETPFMTVVGDTVETSSPNQVFNLIQRTIFLNKLPIAQENIRYSIELHSLRCTEDDNYLQLVGQDSSLNNERLIKLLKIEPTKSYFQLSFRHAMKFIISINSNPESYLVHSMSFISEIQEMFNTICSEDRHTLKLHLRSDHSMKKFHQASNDAHFLLKWAAIEAAKHCISQKFSPYLKSKQFLALLLEEASARVKPFDKQFKLFLVEFFYNLDKLVADRILESSSGENTFVDSSLDQFFRVNNNILASWFSKSRPIFSQLSLTLDNPAECWRNASLKSFQDFAIRFNNGLISKQSSFRYTIMSSDTKNWNLNLGLLALSAQQLDDLALLYGIKAMSEERKLIQTFQPLNSIISNVEGYYEKTYSSLKGLNQLDDTSLVQFLNSCIELGVLEENRECINMFKSDSLKIIYGKYEESKRCDIENIDALKKWFNTWTESGEQCTPAQPISNHINVVVPTCLNIIKRLNPDQRSDFIDQTESIIKNYFVMQCLYNPFNIGTSVKVHKVLIDLLSDKRMIDDHLVRIHTKDLLWNQLLYRHLCDLDMVDELRDSNQSIDLIQFRAAKYHYIHNNISKSDTIIDDLMQKSKSTRIKLSSSFLLNHRESSLEDEFSHLVNIARQAKYSDLSLTLKSDFILKVLRHIMRLPVKMYEYQTYESCLHKELNGQPNPLNGEQLDKNTNLTSCWKTHLDSASLVARIRTMHTLSDYNNRLFILRDTNDDLLNDVFQLDLNLLETLCESKLSQYKSLIIECATRILRHILKFNQRLNQKNLYQFASDEFLRSTLFAWIFVRTNLMAVISNYDNIAGKWREPLVNALKMIGQVHPNLLLYRIIVNRLELEDENLPLKHATLKGCSENCPDKLVFNCDLDLNEEPKLNRRTSSVWDELFDDIKRSSNSDKRWLDVVKETERFLKEIRKISFLSGEYLKTITVKITRKLNSFINNFSLADSTSSKITSKKRHEDAIKRLSSIYCLAKESIQELLFYSKRMGESQMSKYDIWFASTFTKHLRELEYRFGLLARRRPLVLEEISPLVASIIELFSLCRKIINDYNHDNRNKLYMELISPVLSRLEPSLIPMPDCCTDFTSSYQPSITIHKISQTVDLIVSKTSPKRLRFLGSDGIYRSFLLKAHEDLRLDNLFMDLFSTINELLLRKKTSSQYRIRRYPVIPVSSRSGLIRWIEAPSLCSTFKTWFNKPRGKKMITQVYKSTCCVLCQNSTSSHTHCQVPQHVLSTDVFYQLLWAKTKLTKHPLTQQKPSSFNIVKYRSEFDISLFINVVEQLMDRVPNDIVANQLWYNSCDPHSYWLKTQNFIHSNATMSVVGYIIGLGDRHLDNILLDCNTGEVIHIDYSVCFELGWSLSIPEQVPFRLTQNMIRAFGFAGLEGGFRCSCRDVLKVMREFDSTIMHLLEPINLGFMINRYSQSRKLEDTRDIHDLQRQLADFEVGNKRRGIDRVDSVGIDMCSQESVDIIGSIDENDSTILKPTKVSIVSSASAAEIKPLLQQEHTSFDMQHNIEAPTKISKQAAEFFLSRIQEKLKGTDDSVYRIKNRKHNQQRHFQGLNSINHENHSSQQKMKALTIEQQVDGLLTEATSIINRAAMYEGWLPWI